MENGKPRLSLGVEAPRCNPRQLAGRGFFPVLVIHPQQQAVKVEGLVACGRMVAMENDRDLCGASGEDAADRKVGSAVERNRVKRRVREFFRLYRPELQPAHDLLVIARAGAEELSFEDVEIELAKRLDLAVR